MRPHEVFQSWQATERAKDKSEAAIAQAKYDAKVQPCKDALHLAQFDYIFLAESQKKESQYSRLEGVCETTTEGSICY